MRCTICNYSDSTREGYLEYYHRHNRVEDGICTQCKIEVDHNGGYRTILEELEVLFDNIEQEQEATIEQLNKEAAAVSSTGLLQQ